MNQESARTLRFFRENAGSAALIAKARSRSLSARSTAV